MLYKPAMKYGEHCHHHHRWTTWRQFVVTKCVVCYDNGWNVVFIAVMTMSEMHTDASKPASHYSSRKW